ncbi:MAG TPA: UDP-galactopyranose mutase, partial [Verrucomicrobiae bacterium]|nr:UDP-galactopyranose mutase [Verrucomicrobiae bacterium]
GQDHPQTSLVYEYPEAEGDPYYPVPRSENAELYKKYQALAEATPDVHFAGRLATYKYYNMDQVVAQALALYQKVTATEEVVIATPSATIERPTAAQTAAVAGGRSNGNHANGKTEPRSKRQKMDDIIKS